MIRPGLPIAIAALALGAWAPPAEALQDQAAPAEAPTTPATSYVPGNVIVQWSSDADRGDKAEAREEAEVEFENDLGNREFQLVTVEPGQSARAAIDSLEADPAVVLAERDRYISTAALPNDPLIGEEWGLQNENRQVDGALAAVGDADIEAEAAWDRTVGSPQTVVADIDTGYRFEHPDLAGVAWTNQAEANGEPGVDDDGDGIVDDVHGADLVGNNAEEPSVDGDPTDEDLISGGHGVHTAGTIGAEGNNGIGISGVSQDVRIMPLRVCSRLPKKEEEGCPGSSIVAAINYAAAKGARVANMSLTSTSFSRAEVNAIAAAKQTLFVVAAGNDGSNNDSGEASPHGHHYPCDYRPRTQALPAVPGAVDNVVCVAATNQADQLASFSDWGATSVDLAAPGTEILSTYPYETPLADDFSAEDFEAKWPAPEVPGVSDFERGGEAPLESFGMTDSVGPPVADTVRETVSAAVTLPANGGCKLNQSRHLTLSGGEEFRYSVLLDGVSRISSQPGSSAKPGLERRFLKLPSSFEAGGSLQVRFRFSTGSNPEADDGVWLDDIAVECAQGVGQATGYGFLQGTSMATPHVSGAAALLFSLKPTASVTDVREALLKSVTPDPSLLGKTTSGGRLELPGALYALEQLAGEQPPDTAITAAPPATSHSEDAEFSFERVGGGPAGFECRIVTGSHWETCPSAYSLGAGTHVFQVRATAEGMTDPLPASYVWTIEPPSEEAGTPEEEVGDEGETETKPPTEGGGPPVVIVDPPEEEKQAPVPEATPAPSVCLVPKLAGLTLARARSALAAGHCTLGPVHKPKRHRGRRPPALVVKSSTPRAGSESASGTVRLTLGPKPSGKHRHR
jgi:subtilisin family serine protease